jgi:hypothetical protein
MAAALLLAIFAAVVSSLLYFDSDKGTYLTEILEKLQVIRSTPKGKTK